MSGSTSRPGRWRAQREAPATTRAKHGTESRYVLGCRCHPCRVARRAAARRVERRRRAEGRIRPSVYIPLNPRPVRWRCETCGRVNDTRTWSLPDEEDRIRCAHPWRGDVIQARQERECRALAAALNESPIQEGATA